MLNCFLHLFYISQSPRCIDFPPKSVSYSCIFLLTTVIDPYFLKGLPLFPTQLSKISPDWFLYFCLSTNVISIIGELFILEMLSFSGVWLFIAFLAQLDGLRRPKRNVQPTMCASASSTSALPLPVFHWVPFFPQSLCDSWNEKADYASLGFAGQKSRLGTRTDWMRAHRENEPQFLFVSQSSHSDSH